MSTDFPMKSNDNLMEATHILPAPSDKDGYSDAEMDVYTRFMRHLQHVPNSRMDIKILSSIQFTADMVDIGDALAAKILVDMGLRAPRRALPESYLDHADAALLRSGWEVGGPDAALIALKEFWDKIGEDRFAAFRKELPRPDYSRETVIS